MLIGVFAVPVNGQTDMDAYVTGAMEIAGPDGSWVGTWGAVHDAATTALPTWSVMEGTGGYEGWTYLFFTPDQLPAVAETFGILYEGPPPPWGESLPMVPVE